MYPAGDSTPLHKTLRASLEELGDGLQKLLRSHLQLARLELRSDAKAMGRTLGELSLFAILVSIGYLLACTGASFWLAKRLPLELAFVLVGLLNAAAGVAGLLWITRRTPPRERDDAH